MTSEFVFGLGRESTIFRNIFRLIFRWTKFGNYSYWPSARRIQHSECAQLIALSTHNLSLWCRSAMASNSPRPATVSYSNQWWYHSHSTRRNSFRCEWLAARPSTNALLLPKCLRTISGAPIRRVCSSNTNGAIQEQICIHAYCYISCWTSARRYLSNAYICSAKHPADSCTVRSTLDRIHRCTNMPAMVDTMSPTRRAVNRIFGHQSIMGDRYSAISNIHVAHLSNDIWPLAIGWRGRCPCPGSDRTVSLSKCYRDVHDSRPRIGHIHQAVDASMAGNRHLPNGSCCLWHNDAHFAPANLCGTALQSLGNGWFSDCVQFETFRFACSCCWFSAIAN